MFLKDLRHRRGYGHDVSIRSCIDALRCVSNAVVYDGKLLLIWVQASYRAAYVTHWSSGATHQSSEGILMKVYVFFGWSGRVLRCVSRWRGVVGWCDGGGCDVEVSGDDGWRCSLRSRASHARVPSLDRACEAPKFISRRISSILSQPINTTQVYTGEPKQ